MRRRKENATWRYGRIDAQRNARMQDIKKVGIRVGGIERQSMPQIQTEWLTCVNSKKSGPNRRVGDLEPVAKIRKNGGVLESELSLSKKESRKPGLRLPASHALAESASKQNCPRRRAEGQGKRAASPR